MIRVSRSSRIQTVNRRTPPRARARAWNGADESARAWNGSGESAPAVKPRSRLPCSWFATREQFFAAYKSEYSVLTKQLHDSYQHVYAELAFFIDDDDMARFDSSLDVATKHRIERMQKAGIAEKEEFARRDLASSTVKIQTRQQIWDRLRAEQTCPRSDLLVLAETLSFCGTLYRSMYDEWAAFANFVASQKNGSA